MDNKAIRTCLGLAKRLVRKAKNKDKRYEATYWNIVCALQSLRLVESKKKLENWDPKE